MKYIEIIDKIDIKSGAQFSLKSLFKKLVGITESLWFKNIDRIIHQNKLSRCHFISQGQKAVFFALNTFFYFFIVFYDGFVNIFNRRTTRFTSPEAVFKIATAASCVEFVRSDSFTLII